MVSSRWKLWPIFSDTEINMIPFSTEALKGHRVLWKIEICYLIRMTYKKEAYLIRTT